MKKLLLMLSLFVLGSCTLMDDFITQNKVDEKSELYASFGLNLDADWSETYAHTNSAASRSDNSGIYCVFELDISDENEFLYLVKTYDAFGNEISRTGYSGLAYNREHTINDVTYSWQLVPSREMLPNGNIQIVFGADNVMWTERGLAEIRFVLVSYGEVLLEIKMIAHPSLGFPDVGEIIPDPETPDPIPPYTGDDNVQSATTEELLDAALGKLGIENLYAYTETYSYHGADGSTEEYRVLAFNGDDYYLLKVYTDEENPADNTVLGWTGYVEAVYNTGNPNLYSHKLRSVQQIDGTTTDNLVVSVPANHAIYTHRYLEAILLNDGEQYTLYADFEIPEIVDPEVPEPETPEPNPGPEVTPPSNGDNGLDDVSPDTKAIIQQLVANTGYDALNWEEVYAAHYLDTYVETFLGVYYNPDADVAVIVETSGLVGSSTPVVTALVANVNSAEMTHQSEYYPYSLSGGKKYTHLNGNYTVSDVTFTYFTQRDLAIVKYLNPNNNNAVSTLCLCLFD